MSGNTAWERALGDKEFVDGEGALRSNRVITKYDLDTILRLRLLARRAICRQEHLSRG